MKVYLAVELQRQVRERFANCCAYCRTAEDLTVVIFEFEHIVPRSAGGATAFDNLCLACPTCNSYKGANIAGRDPKTRKLTPLFNPRRQKWSRHFRWNGPVLAGRSAIGRTTVSVLNINDLDAVKTRAALIEAGLFPIRDDGA